MKNILLLIHDDAGQEARLQVALDVTRLLDGHLMCLDVAVPPAVLVDDSAGTAVGAALFADEVRHEAGNRARIEQRLAHEEISWDWTDTVGRLAISLRRISRFADLIVVSQRLDDFATQDMRAVAGDVLVKSDRPILAVPQDAQGFDPRCVMIAWNGSCSAMVALQRAVPLLALAQHVFVVEVTDPDHPGDAEDAARYLSRHDIHARIERVDAGGRKIADTLIAEARRHDADLIVAGGFDHSRVTEALFGGVTRTLLADAPCPVFAAH